MQIPAYTKGGYKDLLKQMLVVTNKRGHWELSEHTRLKWRARLTAFFF